MPRARALSRLFASTAVVIGAGALIASTAGLSPLPASAAPAVAPTTEIALDVAYDGTANFSGAPTTLSPNIPAGAPDWTSGEDENSTNKIVRTFDKVGYRIDWNVNEVDATNVVITATLPDDPSTPGIDITWITTPPGCELTGVTPVSALSNDFRTISCNLGDQPEGSSGTIYPEARVGGSMDGIVLDLTADIATDQSAAVTSDPTTLYVSAAPRWDWRKFDPTVYRGQTAPGADGVVGTADDESGWVAVFPVFLIPSGGAYKGIEPLDDSQTISFVDDVTDITPNSRLLDFVPQADPTLRPCQPSDLYRSSLPYGTTFSDAAGTVPIPGVAAGANADTVPSVWTCTPRPADPTRIDVTVSNLGTGAPPLQRASGDPGDGINTVGTIAIFVPFDELLEKASITDDPWSDCGGVPASDPAYQCAKIRFLYNYIGEWDGTSLVNGQVPYDAALTTFPQVADMTPIQNNMVGISGAANAPESVANNVGEYEFRITRPGTRGAWTRWESEFTTQANPARPDGTRDPERGPYTYYAPGGPYNGKGLVYPGAPLYMNNGYAHSSTYIDFYNARGLTPPVQYAGGCQWIDPNVTVSDFPAFDHNVLNSAGDIVSTSPGQAANMGLAHAMLTVNQSVNYSGGTPVAVNPGDVIIEYTDAGGAGDPAGPGNVTTQTPDCGDNEAGPGGWQSDPAVFEDSSGSGTYSAIRKYRWRMTTGFDHPMFAEVFLYGTVNNGLPTGQRIYLHGAIASANTADGFSNNFSSQAYDETQEVNEANGLPGSQPYDPGGISGYNEKNTVIRALSRLTKDLDEQYRTLDADHDGTPESFRNFTRGEEVIFNLKAEVLSGGTVQVDPVTLTDTLPAGLEFVSASLAPTTVTDIDGVPGTGDESLVWNFGNPGQLPWSQDIELTLRIVGGAPFTNLTNGARLEMYDAVDDITTVKTSTASVTLDANPAELHVSKRVAAELGPCILHPAGALPGGWGTRCSMVQPNATMTFHLDYRSERGDDLQNARFIDVLPHSADLNEPGQVAPQPPSYVADGDGRDPATVYTGNATLQSITGTNGETFLYTLAGPATISRDADDPSNAFGVAVPGATLWCEDPAAYYGGADDALTPDLGSAGCPATIADSTAVMIYMPTVDWDADNTVDLVIAGASNEAATIYTNTWGGRTDTIRVSNRSNDVSIMIAPPDLAIAKSTPSGGPFSVGDQVTYAITITNEGVGDATNVTFADHLPVGLGYASDDAGGSASGQDVTWSIPLIAAGSSVTINVTATISAGGSLTNYAEITGMDQPLDTDSTPGADTGAANPPDEDDEALATIEVLASGEPGLQISKRVQGTDGKWYEANTVAGAPSLKLGGKARFRVILTNTGTLPLADIAVSDPWCGLSKTVASLAPGERRVLSCLRGTKLRNSDDGFVNKATATGSAVNADGSRTALAPVSDIARVRLPKLVTTKTGPKKAKAGNAIGYRIVVRNTGSGFARDVKVKLPIAAGSVFLDAKVANSKRLQKRRSVSNRRFKLANGAMTWNLGTIAPGKKKVITVRVRIATSASGLMTCKATITSSNAPRQLKKVRTRISASQAVILPAVTG